VLEGGLLSEILTSTVALSSLLTDKDPVSGQALTHAQDWSTWTVYIALTT